MRVHHRALVGAVARLVVTRAGIPRRRHDALVVVDLVVLDGDPVREAAARRLVEADALARLRPGVRIPVLVVDDLGITGLDVCDELVEEEFIDLGVELAVEAARGRAADHRRQPDLRREPEHLRDGVDLVEHHLLRPGRRGEQPLLRLRVDDDIARERADLAELAAPFRRLEPGVFALLVELLPLGRRADLRARVLRVRHARPRMEIRAARLVRVRIPGVFDALGEDCGICDVLRRDFREFRAFRAALEVLDDAVAAHEQIIEEITVRRALVRLERIGAVGEHALAREAAAVDAARLDVGRADGEQIRQIVVVDERAAHVDRAVDDGETRRVHGRVAVRHGDGARHAADDIVRMRVLAAEDDVRRHELALLVEHLEVVRDRHEMHLRRQQLVVRVIPPVRGEDAELAALDDGLDLALDLGEILRRRRGEIVLVSLCHARVRRAERELVRLEHLVLEVRRRDGIRGECLDGAHPVERVEVIEMDEMILHRQRRRHDVADVVRVLRDADLQRVLHGTHRGERVRRRADAADALDVRPGIARIAVVHDELEAAPGRAGGDGVRDLAALVHRDLRAQMAFDSRDRIYYYMFHLSSTCSLMPCPAHPSRAAPPRPDRAYASA